MLRAFHALARAYPLLRTCVLTCEHEAPSGCTLAHTAGLGMALSKCSKDSSCMRIRGHLSSVHTASAVFGVALSVLLGSRELQPSSLHFTPFQWMLFLYSRLYPPYLYCSTASRLNPLRIPPKTRTAPCGDKKNRTALELRNSKEELWHHFLEPDLVARNFPDQPRR